MDPGEESKYDFYSDLLTTALASQVNSILQIYETGHDLVMGLCMLMKNLQISQGNWPRPNTWKEKSKSQKAKIQLTGCTKKPMRQSRTY